MYLDEFQAPHHTAGPHGVLSLPHLSIYVFLPGQLRVQDHFQILDRRGALKGLAKQMGLKEPRKFSLSSESNKSGLVRIDRQTKPATPQLHGVQDPLYEP